MKSYTKRTMTLVLALACPLLARAEPPADVQQEVGHLLAYIEQSGCEFFRNGIWNSAKTARAHVQGKYNSLSRQGRIHATTDFIEMAASESKLSGNPYQVRCGLEPSLPSGLWLSDELARYQSLRRSAAPSQ